MAAIWKWAVGLLVVINIALLVTIWFRPGNKHNGPPQGGGPAPFIKEQLHLTAEQEKRFDEMRAAHHDSVERLRDKGRTLHNAYFDQLKNPNVDSKTIDSLAKEIADNQVQVEKVTFYHFKELRAMCDEKQKVMFDHIIGDVLARMSPQGQRGQGPPPPR